jgi:hypothetical protein
MTKELVTILPPPDEGALGLAKSTPYTLRDTLTIADAAMIYCDRHPRPGFFWAEASPHGTAFIDVIEEMIGKGADRDIHPGTLGVWQTSWAVYCTLRQSCEKGAIPAARAVYDSEGKINPLLTEIPLSTLLDLARQRGDAGEIVSSLLTWYDRGEIPAAASTKIEGQQVAAEAAPVIPAAPLPPSKPAGQRGRKTGSGEINDAATLREMLCLLAGDNPPPSINAAARQVIEAGKVQHSGTPYSAQRRIAGKFSASFGPEPPPGKSWRDVYRRNAAEMPK